MKTLGVKFQVAGVKEAQAGLNNLRKNLNSSLKQNKQAVKQSIGLNQTVRQELEQSNPDDFVDNYQRTVAAVRNKQYREAVNIYARPRINRTVGGFFEGIGNAAGGRAFNQLDNLFRRLTGREEYRESVDLSERTINRIGESVALALTGKSRSQSQRDRNLGKRPQAILQRDSLVDKAVDQALLPLKTIQYSFYEGIGSFFGDQFATGLSDILNQELDFSMNRKGQVTGKAISYTATTGVDNLKRDVGAVGDNYNDLRYAVEDGKVAEISKKFDTLIKSVTKSVTSIADSYLRGYRKGSVRLEALRKMDREINAQNNQAPDLTGKDKVIYTVSGFAGEKGQRGNYLAQQVKPYVNNQTEVIGVENEFTDVLAPADKSAVMWGISALANLAKINLKGFNPDAVKLAAKVVNTLAKNPNVKVDMLGHSAGGFVVEEAQEILNQLGFGQQVTAKTAGTPRMAGNLDNPNVTRIMGDNDFRIKPLEEALEYVGAADPTDKVVSGVKDHFFEDYLASDQFLKEAFGDSLDPKKVKAIRQKQQKFQGKLIELETLYTRYISTIYQDLDDLGEELSVAPDRMIAKNRRAKLRDRGGQELKRKLDSQDYRQIKLKEETQTAILVSGGFSGARGRSGAKFAKGLNELVDDETTQYIGVRNPFTDVFSPDDVRNPDSEKMIPQILDMFGEVHKLGYNPDAVEIAAQVMDLLKQNPNLNVKVAGYSGGGYVMEDVMELLQSQNVDMSRVQLMGVGTPNLPGGIKNRDFQKVLGAKDPVVAANQLKEINNEVKKIIGFNIFPELMTKLQNVEGIETHDLDEYVANSKEVQDFFYGHIPNSSELIENYAEINSLQKDTSDLNSQMSEVQANKSLNPAQKLERLNQIRERYINLLRQIHTLAKYSQSIGGGQVFADERELAAIELEEAGVIVDPIKVQVPEQDPLSDSQPEEQKVIVNRVQALAEQYKKYLQNLIKQSSSDSNQTAFRVSRDFKSLDNQSQQNYIQTIRTAFNTKARLFRDAVRTGQLEIVREQGEQLILLAALIKNLYAGIESDSQIDPAVKNNLKGYARYATSVQNEVVSGSRSNGRAAQGLTQNFENQLNLEQNGEDIAEGFVYGILDNLAEARSAGEQLVDAVDEGVRERGEIQSPSKLFKRLGRWVARGFGLGMAAENLEERGREVVEDAADGFKDQIQQSFDPDNLASLLDTGGAGLINKIGSLIFDASQNENFDQALDIISKLLGKVVRLVVTFKLLKVGLDALGLGKFIDAFSNLPEKALESAIAVESLDNRINQMSGSASLGAKNLDFISEAADRLNRNLTEAKENFSQVLRATRDTPLEGFQTENIYTAFAATAKQNALSSADEQGLFRSVRSMIGKGRLSQEEVRQEVGERLGDFEQSLADAYGVSRPYFNQMMEDGIQATEALPKVAAVLRAKNDIYGDLDTGAAAAQRLDNSVSSFHESVGNALLPLQKFGNNFLAGFFNQLAGWIEDAKGLVHGFFIALFLNLLRLQIFGQSVQKMLLGLIKLLWTMKGAMGVFLAEMVLIAAAWKVWENVIKIFSDRYFPQINKDIDQLTRGMKAYRQAIDEANDSQSNLGNGKLQLAEGFKLPENKIGDAIRGAIGSDYLNLDSLVRKPLDSALSSKYGDAMRYLYRNSGVFGLATAKLLPQGFTTRREQKEQQLKIDNSRLSIAGNKLLAESGAARNAAQEITKYDAQIDEIQSKRLKLLPGDAEALKASLAEEKKINQERDKQLRILTNYQQTLQTSINVYKTRLEDVEQRFLSGEIDQSTYNAEKNNLTGLRDATENELKGINSELNKASKNLTVFQRRLRNSNERIEGFLAQSDRELQLERAGIIESGIASGSGTQTIQIELEEAQKQDLQRRINFVKEELSVLERDLKSPELSNAVRRIKQQFVDSNKPLNETGLQKLIEQTTVKADRDAAEGLLKQLRDETKIAGLTEQLANTLQQNRNAVLDFNRTINDYFFRITQQIKEAQLETDRLLSQIFYTDIKNRLRSAIAPGSNTFVNGIIDNIQSVIDQASQIAQKVFGDSAAQLGFESESRTMATEMQDFIRQVGNAGDALQAFTDRVNGIKPAPPSVPPIKGDAEGRGVSAGRSFPIAGLTPDTAKITSGYGWRRIFGRKDFHEGIDIAASGGTAVRATNSGIVRHIKPLADQTQVGIETAKGVMEWFIHLGQNLRVNKGDRVAAGNVIGYVAKTTQQARRAKVSTGDHLDYRVQVNGKWVNPMEYLKSQSSLVSNVNQPQVSNSLGDQALGKVQQLLGLKQKNLNISQLTTEQEREALAIQVKQTIEANKRAIGQGNRENARSLLNVQNRFAEFGITYDFQSADNQAKSALRQIEQQFLDANQEVNNQVRNTEDAISTIQNALPVLDSEISRLKAIGTPEALAVAKTKEAAKTELKSSLADLEANLTKIKAIQEDSADLEAKYTQFVITQNELKKQQENFNKQNLKLNQQAFIAQQRGTIEQQRQVKIAQEELRFKLAIAKLQQDNKPGEHLDSLIKGEERQSQINLENIDFKSQQEELDLEKQLLDLQSQIDDKKGGFLSKIGLDLQGDKLKKQSAIAAENIRYQKQLLQIQKDFAKQPDKLAEFTAKAQELNRVNLDNINSQFKSLGGTVRDAFISSTQGFFDNVVNNFFDGATQQNQQALQERLRYTEEILQLEQQYQDQPGMLFHLKSRARELNEQKLDKVAGEFNILNRAADLAKQAIAEVVKQMAAMAAKQAAGRFLSSILGGVFGGTPLSSPLLGGTVGGGGTAGGFAGGVSAFVADEGATVGSSDIKGRKIGDRATNYLRRSFPGVAQAWKAEGEGARLGVFHTGEELLSRKTGEAGRYQALKQQLGINPLAKIGVFADGGTVGFDAGANILSGFTNSSPGVDLSALSVLDGRGQRAEGRSMTVNLSQQIYTPNEDSFRLNADQRNQDLLESLQRGLS
ncbi:MAG: peptidoglycan DD-metalloendopeptidase family protein [Cyanobacteria bacterium P01_A01_bin.40]